MAITDLPTETLEHIVAGIDSPADLRNLAAVCTQLLSIIEPNHTQFRFICAPLISSLWKKFAENQFLAQNIRILEVQSEDAEADDDIIPTIFSDMEVLPSIPDMDIFEDSDVETLRKYYAAQIAMDLDAERILVSALKGMSGLTLFRWNRTPPLINRNQEDDIWSTLAKYCPSLNVIDVIDRENPHEPLLLVEESDDPPYQRPSRNPNFYLFKDLKSFSFVIEAFNVVSFLWPEVKQCSKMLVERCPNLEVLDLSFANFIPETLSGSPLLSGPPWNSLRELTLFGFHFISTELSSFLASHPTIEILSLKCCQIDQHLVLPPHTLPRLKQLSTDLRSTIVNSVLDSAIAIPRPLNYIMGPLLNDVSLDSLEQCGSGPNLDELVMLYNDGDLGRLITRLSGIAPNLESLGIRVRGQEIDPTLYPVFGQFPGLHVLKGMQFLSPTCEPASENTERIRALVTLCPDLWRIDWYVDNQLTMGLSVIIEQDGSHVTWSLRIIDRERDIEGVYTEWGERGHGSFEL